MKLSELKNTIKQACSSGHISEQDTNQLRTIANELGLSDEVLFKMIRIEMEKVINKTFEPEKIEKNEPEVIQNTEAIKVEKTIETEEITSDIYRKPRKKQKSETEGNEAETVVSKKGKTPVPVAEPKKVNEESKNIIYIGILFIVVFIIAIIAAQNAVNEKPPLKINYFGEHKRIVFFGKINSSIRNLEVKNIENKGTKIKYIYNIAGLKNLHTERIGEIQAIDDFNGIVEMETLGTGTVHLSGKKIIMKSDSLNQDKWYFTFETD